MPRKTYYLVCMALGAALLTIGAYLKFPIGLNVQFTTQVFFLLIIGLVLPFPYSSLSVLVYIILGLMGLPVFSRGGGLHIVFTPEFGYLLGFLFAASIMNPFYRFFKSKALKYYVCAVIGALSVYPVALIYIGLILPAYSKVNISIQALLSAYFIPFLPMDIIKALFAALIANRLHRAIPYLTH